MDVIRRNTDYALRLMVNLAVRYESRDCVSARILSQQEDVSYSLSCKLLHRLNTAGLVSSSMGTKGGFALDKPPGRISVLDVIEVIQGPLVINRCVLNKAGCPRQSRCPISAKLKNLQEVMTASLSSLTMADLAGAVK